MGTAGCGAVVRLPVNSSHGQLVTWSARHTVMSSLGELVTSQLVSHVFFTESTRHNAVIYDGQRHTILGDFRT